MTISPNAGQVEFWNAEPGRNWVAHAADMDAMMRGILDLLMAAAAPHPGERALDIGCGAGASTFALAEAVGPTGAVLGLDISAPLLERAEAHCAGRGATNVRFERADAQDHPLAPEGFDLAASRFGVMFFADPVAAFRNVRTALRPGGRIAFVAWAGPEVNPWFATPQRIAVARLGPVDPVPPEAPGPMAFRDADRVCGILTAAGFEDVVGETVATHQHHPGGVEAVIRLARDVGPTSRVLRERNGTPEDQAAILAALAEDFAQYSGPDGIKIPAAINVFTGRRP